MTHKIDNNNPKISIGLNVIITIFEIVLGIIAGSLALPSYLADRFKQ